MNRRVQSFLAVVGIAIASTGVAALIRLLLNPIIGDRYPYATFFFAIVVAAWFGGLRSAILSVILGGFAVNAFISQNLGSWFPNSSDQWIGLALYYVTGFGIALFDGGRQHSLARANNIRLRRMADAMPQIVWAADANGIPTYMNSRWKEYSGIDSQDPKDTVTTVHPDDVKKMNLTWRESLQSGLPFSFEVRIKSAATSEYRWFLARAVPVLDEKGVPLEWFGTSTDIHDLKSLSESVHQSKSVLQMVLDSIPIGVFWKDRNSRYLGCNRVAAKAVGFEDPNRIVGSTDAELGIFSNELVEHFISKDREVMESNQPQYDVVDPHPGADGSVAWLSKNKLPLHDDQGHVVGVLATWQDVTEQRRAMEAVHFSRAMLQLVLDSVPQGVFWKDRNAKYLGCNIVVAKALGFKKTEQIIGLTDYDFPSFTKEQIEFYRSKDFEVMESDQAQIHITETFTLSTGKLIWLETNKFPMHDESGRVIGLLGTWEDVTDRREAEENLRFSERRLRALIENSSDSISVIAPDNSILYLSPSVAKVEGYTAEELTNRNGLENTHPDDLDLIHRTVEKLLANPGKPIPIIWRRRHKDGRWLWLEGVSTNLIDDPAVKGIVTNYRDITERKRLEDARERLSQLIEQSHDFIAMADMDGRLTFMNHGAKQMIGLEKDADPGAVHFTEYVPPDWLEFFQNTVLKTIRAQGSWEGEMQLQNLKTGQRIDVYRSAFMIRDFEGKPSSYATVTRDITESKRAQIAIRESEERYRMMFEANPHAMWVYDLETLRFLAVNETAVQNYGYSRDEFLGMTLKDIRPAEDFARLESRIAELSSKVLGGTTWRHRKKNGEMIDVEISSRDFRSGDKNARIVLAVDVTERNRAEEAFHESEERLRSVTEQAKVGLVMVDEEHRYQYVNRAYTQLMHVMNDNVVGRHIRDVLGPVYESEIRQRLESAFRGESVEYEISLPTRADPTLHCDYVVTYHPGRYRGKAVIVVVIVDITDRKRAEAEVKQLNAVLEDRVRDRTAQLEAANRELEAFSYSVSHDLRAPLRAVDGFSRILIDDYGPQLPALAKEYLDDVRNGARQMGRLIDDLLAFSRLGRQILKKTTVNTAELVRTCLGELQKSIDGRQVEINVAVLPDCQADASLLKQVWINLIANAFKYSRNRSQAVIEIGFEKDGKETTFFVKDNGVGFDMRYAHKLFKVFQRLHRAEDFEGTGVGLAIVQRVIHRHGGQVRAESKHDHGATFFFTLPNEGVPSHET